jgi:hypothetical protein
MKQYGQEKQHGLPIVVLMGGLIKMWVHSATSRTSNYQAAQNIVGSFAKFGQKHHKLPPIFLTPFTHPDIIELYKTRSVITTVEALTTHGRQSLCPHLDHIYQLFHHDALELMGEKKTMSYENTKLIIEILERPTIDIKEFYDTVAYLGYIPPNWAVIRLVAKER